VKRTHDWSSNHASEKGHTIGVLTSQVKKDTRLEF